MYKIIQFLRASRLILLIILLLITIVSQLARADTSRLYYAGAGNIKGLYAGTPLAACQLVFPDTQTATSAMPDRVAGSCEAVNQAGNKVTFGAYSSIEKTCETKELTHNGTSDGVPSNPKFHWMRAPNGLDAKDWYSDRFNTCENNCIVLNVRYIFPPDHRTSSDGRSVTESDGTSRSMFTKRQTGTVCVNEKKKPDEPIKPPPPVDDDKPDNGKQPDNGQSGGDAGNADNQNNGQGSGSNGGGSDGGGTGDGSSGSGNGSSQDNSSGNDGSGGTQSGGSGGGSGGSQGGGLQIGPGGGGTSGGQGSGNADSGSQGGDSGEGSDNGDGKSDSGNGSGQGSDQSGGDGAITGDNDGKGEGEGDGKGEGSISGGSCAAEQAPSCKGDPVQCYIAVEQWRTACATAGNKSEITSGNCVTNTPPECIGDATQCYIARQQWQQGCLAADEQSRINELEKYGKGKVGEAQAFADGSGFDGIGEAIKGNDSIVNIPSQLDTSGFGWSRTCPALSFSIDAKIFGAFNIDFSFLCGLANLLGNLFVAVSLVLSARYILR